MIQEQLLHVVPATGPPHLHWRTQWVPWGMCRVLAARPRQSARTEPGGYMRDPYERAHCFQQWIFLTLGAVALQVQAQAVAGWTSLHCDDKDASYMFRAASCQDSGYTDVTHRTEVKRVSPMKVQTRRCW